LSGHGAGRTPRELVIERLRRQMPLEEKRKFADYVIDTSGTTDDTIEQRAATHEICGARTYE